jgi:hypothetical protein
MFLFFHQFHFLFFHSKQQNTKAEENGRRKRFRQDDPQQKDYFCASFAHHDLWMYNSRAI